MRWHPVLEHFEDDSPGFGLNAVRLIMIVPLVRMTVSVAVMMPAAAQQPGARDVYSQAETGNRDRLGKVDGDGRKNTADGFVGDQQCDHRQNNGAGETGEVAEIAGTKREVRIIGTLAGVR